LPYAAWRLQGGNGTTGNALDGLSSEKASASSQTVIHAEETGMELVLAEKKVKDRDRLVLRHSRIFGVI
jgi:hypothetical protein